MKKIVSLLLIIMVVLLNSSCGSKGRGFDHHFEYYYIDESNYYCDEYYVSVNREGEDTIFTIFNIHTSAVVDKIILKQKNNNIYSEIYISDENIIYIFGFYKDKKLADCYYKTIGSNENIEEQLVVIDDNQYIIQINNEKFFIYFINHSSNITGSVNIFKVNSIQSNGKDLFYTSISSNSDIYNIDVKNEEVVMTNYFDNNINYTYSISKEIKDAKYIYGNNALIDEWSFGCDNSEDIEASRGSYELLSQTTKLMSDGNLYFAYGRYLGEFEKCYCFLYRYCILSNRMCEILRFNTKTKQIERVALIPETYTVLAIYEDCAIIMNNERIGTYYYDTQEIKDSIEVDIAGEIFKTEYEWPDQNGIKFYFKDKKIEKYVPYKSNHLVLNSYSNILFVE